MPVDEPDDPSARGSRRKPGPRMDNTRLVAECLRGNEQAWSLLIDKYKALIYSIPVKYRLPPHEAADVFQATCAELLVRLPQLRDPEALPKWLMQVAHHECYRWKRQQQRMISRDAEPDFSGTADSGDRRKHSAANAKKSRCCAMDEHLIATMPSIGRIAFLRDARASLRPSGQGTGLAVGSNRIHPPKCIDACTACSINRVFADGHQDRQQGVRGRVGLGARRVARRSRSPQIFSLAINRCFARSSQAGLLRWSGKNPRRCQQALLLSKELCSFAAQAASQRRDCVALRAKANALFASTINLGAVEHHDQAFKIYEALKIWKEAARNTEQFHPATHPSREYDRAFAAPNEPGKSYAAREERRLASLDQ